VTIRKPIINPNEAVKLIRMGFSDEGLMKKYSISARGLESLYRKLVQAGELDPTELEQRTGLLDRCQSVILAPAASPAPPRMQIGVREAVEAIRSGMSDLELMRKYSLSAKGVDKLFRKLILSGQLDQEELDQRAYASQMFQVAELDELPEPFVPKPRVKAADAVRDIRSGMSDAVLMEKYELSSKGLESLFRKLVKAGEIMEAELDQRLLWSHSSHYVDLDVPVQPSDAKCRIKATDAIRDIRAGMNDAAIMKKYDISVKGLSSLFRKLVMADKIEQAELDRRHIVSQQSHFVDLDERPEPAATKIRVKASELAGCVRSGMHDAAIMERFNLSARGLGSLLKKLVAAGRIRQADLDARRNVDDSADVAFPKDARGPEARGACALEEENGEFELASPSPQGTEGFRWQNHRTAVIAGVAAIVLVTAAILMDVHVLLGNRIWHVSHGRTDPASLSKEDFQKQVAEVTAIMESISHDPYRKASLEAIPGAQSLQECLKTCTRDHASSDHTERGLLLNCRMECMAKHGTAIKAIRKRYYEDDPFE
jgi:uncharacterized protein (DUF433 family)